jgi:spore maturation protein CgeB
MKIIYVGPMWYGSTALLRFQAMQELGHEVVPVDTEPVKAFEKMQRLHYRIVRRFIGDRDLSGANDSIISGVQQQAIDVVWVDKGVTISPDTLKEAKDISPETILVHFNMDNPFGKVRYGWRTFLKAAPFYDVHFVARESNLDQYKAIGCRDVRRFYNSYDRNLHRPITVSVKEREEFGGAVGFIGDYEKERTDAMLFLAENGIPVKVWGPNWDRKCKIRHNNLKITTRFLKGEDYVKAVRSIDINLGFLRKVNEDFHTTRSLEIPACGAFMLAERTQEHLHLFREGIEAEFFGSYNELMDKVKYYMANNEKRRSIGLEGRERCIRSGYSYHDRLALMLKDLQLQQKAH